ncbi:DUF6571 family protein [Streptomyces sp. NPDC021093]|uniref:DUF6571 family protein n=1 Tax=Streptomyces sp. NPDC021093 TaxID=3365112 RepID=UPI0037AF5D7F
MPTYHEIMTTELSALTTAATRWDGMAGEFKKQELAYRRDVYGVSLGETWQGLSADAAHSRFGVTLREFRYARKEAKAVADLLRDAHTRFVELRGKLQSARREAVEAGMKVSDQGVVTFDSEKLTASELSAMQHDPDYQQAMHKSVNSWQQLIDQAVRAVNDADKGTEIALRAVVVDSKPLDGTTNGFNSGAQGDIEKYEAQALKDIAERVSSGKATDQDLQEAQRSFRDNAKDEVFGRTLLSSLGAEGTLKFNNSLTDLGHSGDSHNKDYLGLQKGLATTLATATQNPNSAFYDKFRTQMQSAGVKQYDLDVAGNKIDVGHGHGQKARGYQSLVTLMQQGGGYSDRFLHDTANDIRKAEDKDKGGDPDIWDLRGDFGDNKKTGKNDSWFANDPLDGVLGIMAKDPAAATAYLDPGPHEKNDNLKYLLDKRDWDLADTREYLRVETAGKDVAEHDVRQGFGAALEAAATGHQPGTEHKLGGHGLEQARVMNETIGVLNESGHADKLPANLQKPLANMLTDYTPDSHQILGMDNVTYNGKDEVWKDEDGTVRMAVPKDDLVKVMRGAADDPEAFGQMYRAEKQYSQDLFTGMPNDSGSDSTRARIQETSAALGAYDGVRSDVVFDKRFNNTQWANDFNHALTTSSGAALTFVGAAYGPAAPAAIAPTGDIVNRVVDFVSYEATKERIAEANLEATKENARIFNAGQLEVDGMVAAWAKSHGHEPQDDFVRNLVGHGQGNYEKGRDGALRAMRPDF